jgi:hypothetical protein
MKLLQVYKYSKSIGHLDVKMNWPARIEHFVGASIHPNRLSTQT